MPLPKIKLPEKKPKQPKEKKPPKVKREKKPAAPKPKKEKKVKKGKEKNAPVDTAPKTEGQDDEAVKSGKKKLSKKAMIVTIAVILVIVLIVVAILLFVLPKFSKGDTDVSGSDTSQTQGSSSEDVSGTSSGTDGESSVPQYTTEDGIPLVPDPEIGLMTTQEAQAVVEAQFDTEKYKIKTVEEKIFIHDQPYSAFSLFEGETQIGSSIAVNRLTGEYLCYYPDQVFSHIIDYPLVPADASGYPWNGSYQRTDSKGNISSVLTVKQLEENEMHFVISTYMGKESETLSGLAKVKNNVAVYTDGDFFRIEFVVFGDQVTVTESGKNKHEINATFDGQYGPKETK